MRYHLNPNNQHGVFRRTIRVEGREPRMAKFVAGEVVDLDKAECEFMAKEIRAELIVREGYQAPPKVKKVEPKRDPLEDDPDRKDDIYGPLPSERHGVDSWASRTLNFFFPNA